MGTQDPGPGVRVEPLPAVPVRGEPAARDEGPDEVGPHQGVPARDEHVLLGEGALAEPLPHQGELLARPLVTGRAHGVEVGAEGGSVEVQPEAQQVDFSPTEGDVQLDPDRQLDTEAAGFVEHRPFPPAIGGEGVVVGDGDGPHAARRDGGQEGRRVELSVARARVEVEVG